jgi:acetyl-CoA C-acetyltransferase
MRLDRRAPLVAGAAAVSRRCEDPSEAVEALDLMAEAAEQAADDAGARSLLGRVSSVIVPKGMWGYGDPGRVLANRFRARDARTIGAEIGVLQTTLFARAAEEIANGADVVLVVGGEARHSAQQARRAGLDAPETVQGDVEPDVVLRPADDIVHPVEIARNLVMPVHAYACMESRWRAEHGMTVDEHRRDLAELWHRFSRVAVENPDAWDRTEHTVDELVGSASNMTAFPYAKRHTSQWNVDQAAAILFCSAEAARAAGVPSDRFVFPHAVADSNHMVPVVARAEPHRSPQFGIAGRRALGLAAVGVDDVAHLELYSCFPIAVRVQCDEIGIEPDRRLTQTGGMAFAGGPLNSFVLQALARMVEVLRADPGSRALVTAVSGMITKQGASVWSTEPPADGFRFADVTGDAQVVTERRDVRPDATGDATVAACTVVHDRQGPVQSVAICECEDGARTVAATEDSSVMASMESDEWCGRRVHIPSPGVLAG